MALPLRSNQLFEQLLKAIDDGGWQYLIRDDTKPFRLRIFRGDEKGFDVRIYIWNCTHGGGQARASDEYRVQLTGVVPSIDSAETTLLLGWHAGYGVFVGFDIRKHDGQNSRSPSIQIKEETLQSAHAKAFAIYHRQNGEIAVAFKPEFLVDYALNSQSLHQAGESSADFNLLNNLNTLTDIQIDHIQNLDRRIIMSTITRKFRTADFRKRVLGAYHYCCAACGIQLELVDAAHIIPVAAPSSNDETRNGIALCKLHHSAFDRNLISFNEKYKIEVSRNQENRLGNLNRLDGLEAFKNQLRTAIILPADRRDYPPANYITESRKIRNWRAN